MRLSKIGRNIQSKLNQTVTSRIPISNSLPATLDKEEIKKVEQNQTEPNSSLSMVEKKKKTRNKNQNLQYSHTASDQYPLSPPTMCILSAKIM